MNKRLQQFLDLENLTPARLADILGVQRSGMSHILSGRNKPSYDFIIKIISKFPEVDANWFLTGKGKPYKEMNSHSAPAPSASPSSSQHQVQSSAQYSSQTFGQPNSYQELSSHLQNSKTSQSGVTTFGSSDFVNSSLGKSEQLNGNSENDQRGKNEEILEIGDDLFSFDSNENPNRQSSNFSGNNINSQNRAYLPNNKEDIPILKQEQPRENQKFAENRVEGFKKRSVKRVIIFYTDGSFEEMYPSGRE